MRESVEITHTSSQRTRDLLEQNFAVAKLSDYAAGNIQKLLTMLNTAYAAFVIFNDFAVFHYVIKGGATFQHMQGIVDPQCTLGVILRPPYQIR